MLADTPILREKREGEEREESPTRMLDARWPQIIRENLRDRPVPDESWREICEPFGGRSFVGDSHCRM